MSPDGGSEVVAAPSATHQVVGRTSRGPDRDHPVECVTLRAGAFQAQVLSYGAHLVSVRVPDRAGRVADVVSSLRDADGQLALARYEDHVANPHLGSIVGRYANRIGGARLELDGRVVELLANEGANQLHGGPSGFDRHVWSARSSADARTAQVTLVHVSPHGDQGYPGTLEVQARYELDVDGVLRLTMDASTDATTVVNLTNHSYWNLRGTADATPRSLGEHLLRVNAHRYVEVDTTMLPTGRLLAVGGTSFDLRSPRSLATVIADPALSPTRGLDHCLLFDDPSTGGGTAELHDPVSGRRLRLRTDQPGVQVYTSNHGSGDLPAHATVCLETQLPPDAPNQAGFPSAVLRPGERYHHVLEIRFDSI
jgi:aldose 1-epimerase